MLKKFVINRLLHPWKIPCMLGFTALLACIPVIFPFAEAEPQQIIRDICGWVLMLSVGCSLLHVIITAVHFFLRLKNMRALWQITAFFTVWGVVVLLFTQLAIEADPPSPYPQEEQKGLKQADTLHEATAHLQGPSTLCTYLPNIRREAPITHIHEAANLLKLEKDHAELFEQYLNTAPKWAYTANDDTFYSKPGHVVFVAPSDSEIPGMVHAAFRSVSAGETLPDGYEVMAPGAAIPTAEEALHTDIPDIALDLGGKRYLLLAWRGAESQAAAYKAINATIAEIDTQLAPLAETPTPETIEKLIRGKDSIKGNKTELLLTEPASQFGIYQAEIYANPGQEGTLILVIRERDTHKALLLYSHAARYSADSEVLFRHDVPLALHDKEGRRRMGNHVEVFGPNAPFFTLKEGEAHRYFAITAEVHFSPAGSRGDKTELLLKRHYNVQAYEKAEEPAAESAQENGAE